MKIIIDFLSKDLCDNLINRFKDYDGNYRIFNKRYTLNLLNYPNDILFKQVVEKYKQNNKEIKNIKLIFWPIGEFHKWHNDTIYYDYTSITYLNEGYVGGRTIIKENNEDIEIEPKIGKYIGFESNLQHKVTELIEGHRFVLLCWY